MKKRIPVLLAGSFGGAFPCLLSLGIGLTLDRDTLPSWTFLIGVLILALLGGVVCGIYGETDYKKAFVLGIGLPALFQVSITSATGPIASQSDLVKIPDSFLSSLNYLFAPPVLALEEASETTVSASKFQLFLNEYPLNQTTARITKLCYSETGLELSKKELGDPEQVFQCPAEARYFAIQLGDSRSRLRSISYSQNVQNYKTDIKTNMWSGFERAFGVLNPPDYTIDVFPVQAETAQESQKPRQLVQSQPDLNSGSVHLIMGNPSGATQDASNADNFLLLKPQYALSYNNSKSIANWVSWQLSQKWLGNTPRCKVGGQDGFAPDPSLPSGFKPVLPTDYQGSGFDRGHMTPSADSTANKTDNCATFLMTNIIPQSPDVNQGPWETLESYSRDLAKDGKELYIISGGAGEGGEGKNGRKTSFKGKSSKLNITVPASSWKVIVVLDKPGLGLSGINKNTRVIAVNMPQKQRVKGEPWDIKVSGKPKYITSVKELEKLTEYNFLSNVPKDVQDYIEAKVDKGS